MKKLIISLFFIVLTTIGFSQGLFQRVDPFPTVKEKGDMLAKGIIPATSKLIWRFDASIAIEEINYNKELKNIVTQQFSAVGPAIGLQNFIPTSATDPTPFNNWGVSMAFLLGKSIYNPELAAFKIALQANIWQYFKFGVTYTVSTPTNVSHIGAFFGGGLTF